MPDKMKNSIIDIDLDGLADVVSNTFGLVVIIGLFVFLLYAEKSRTVSPPERPALEIYWPSEASSMKSVVICANGGFKLIDFEGYIEVFLCSNLPEKEYETGSGKLKLFYESGGPSYTAYFEISEDFRGETFNSFIQTWSRNDPGKGQYLCLVYPGSFGTYRLLQKYLLGKNCRVGLMNISKGTGWGCNIDGIPILVN